MGSFFQPEKKVAEFEARYPEPAPNPYTRPANRDEPGYPPPIGGLVDVPITIGRRR